MLTREAEGARGAKRDQEEAYDIETKKLKTNWRFCEQRLIKTEFRGKDLNWERPELSYLNELEIFI